MPIFAPLMKYALAGMAITTLILGLALHFERVHARKSDARIVELTQLRKSDRQSYEAAQAQAHVQNIVQVKQIEAHNEAITNDIRNQYQRDLERLRAQSRANPGASGKPGASGVPQAPGGTDGNGLSNPPCDDLCASEIELRLMYLQNWISEQIGTINK